MTGNTNAAYEGDDTQKDKMDESCDGMELKVTDGRERANDGYRAEDAVAAPPSPPSRGDDLLCRTILVVRGRAWGFFARHKRLFAISFHVGLHIALACYLAGVVVVYNYKGHSVDYWHGMGLLIVMYAFLYGCLIYYFVAKPYLGSGFVKYVSEPLEAVGTRLCERALFRCLCYLVPVIGIIAYLFFDSTASQKRLVSFSGIVAFIIFGFIFSDSPGHVRWRPVMSGLFLQFAFGLMTLKWNTGRSVLKFAGDQISVFLNYTHNGTTFVYGPLVSYEFVSQFSTTFAFSVLPVIFFFSFFVNILSYYNILQWVVMKTGWLVQIVMGTTVCESFNAAASIFLGMTESVLLFKHQLKDLTKSELHAIMCEGWSTVAGTVLAAYISFKINPSHLIAASVMSAPASLSYSKLFYPEKEESKQNVKNIVLVKQEARNFLDAASKGTTEAIAIIACIIANIIAFMAFVAFLDAVVNWFGLLLDFPQLSFQFLMTKLFVPISFLMGVDTESLEDVALLIGTKTFVNEFQAYEMMGKMKHKFSPRTEAITTFALCGFSNIASIGMMLGTLTALEPSQGPNIMEVALRAFIAANIVCFITACVAGTIMDI